MSDTLAAYIAAWACVIIAALHIDPDIKVIFAILACANWMACIYFRLNKPYTHHE